MGRLTENSGTSIVDKVWVTNNALCESVYDPVSHIVYSTYQPYDKSGETRALFFGHMENMVRFAGHHPVRGIVADLRGFTGQVLHALAYLDKEIMPEMKKQGLIGEAFVASHAPRNRQLCLQLVALQNRQGVKARMFYHKAEAEEWLVEAINQIC